MDVVLLVLAAFALADVVACGVLLLIVWGVYRRDVSRAAPGSGEPAPPFPARTCLGIGLVLLFGLGSVYGLVWLAVRGLP